MKTVSFTRMEDGTAEDYALLDSFEEAFMKGLPDRLLRALDGLKGSFDGYQVTRYDHSLQAATRAHRDGRDEEYVVATLLHDIGDELARSRTARWWPPSSGRTCARSCTGS
jgi:predicted HD phosphohydrolase